MIQTLFDFPVYLKFFIGLFVLVDLVGIIPAFISVTSYQTVAVRNKTNLTANLSVTIISWVSSFPGNTILQLFGISIDSFHIAGGVLIVTIAMSMISGRLGGDKQNKQEKSEVAVCEDIGVVPLALSLMAGPRMINSTVVWDTHYHSISYLFGSFVTAALFALCRWELFRMTPWPVRALRQTGVNAITHIMRLLLVALGIESIVVGIKEIFPGLLN